MNLSNSINSTDPAEEQAAGRSCPIRYRYGPDKIAQLQPVSCQVLYVVGGLYGNPYALDAIEALASSESLPARICFNGDFNWFNHSAQDFAHINQRVLKHDCILGNVEAELGEPLDVADCGCAYPASVDQGVVERSNQIHSMLKRTAQANPELLELILSKPFIARYRVEANSPDSDAPSVLDVAVVHGDGDSLSGWRFDPDHLHRTEELDWRVSQFERAQVDVFASSHTCAAAFHVQPLPSGQTGLISNNGAAGMPSVPGSLDGLVTRIGAQPFHQQDLVHQSTQIKGVWVEQLRVQYPQAAWRQHFLTQWPEGSAAHTSYFQRICAGPGNKGLPFQ